MSTDRPAPDHAAPAARHPGGHPGQVHPGQVHPGGAPAGPEAFDRMYAGTPSWELGRPQPAVIRAEEAGRIVGDVIDVGCGTGTDARWLADRGHRVVGVDFSPKGIERALAGPPSAVRFVVADARDLAAAGFGPGGERFDTALDVGCFHAMASDDRARYAGSVRDALRPGGTLVLLCWSDRNTFAGGPARISEADVRAAFTEGWAVESVEPEVLESPREPGTVQAWLAVVRRV